MVGARDLGWTEDMSDTTRPDGDELEDQLTIADDEAVTDDGTVKNDPATDDTVSDVLPQGIEEPDPPVGIP